MTAKKFLIPFVLASLAGHALIIALTARIDRTGGLQPEKVMNVELTTPTEVDPPLASARSEPPRRRPPVRLQPAATARIRSPCKNPGGLTNPYLLQIRRKIEGLLVLPAAGPLRKAGGKRGDPFYNRRRRRPGRLLHHLLLRKSDPRRGRSPASGPPHHSRRCRGPSTSPAST